MKVRFFKTTKRVNSTYIPTTYTEYDCQLKDMVAITAPQIRLSVFTDYNYCYIPTFNRYYFVTGCVIESHGIYTYSLAVDVLATYKTQILSKSTYVKRSASNYDLNLIDDTWLHDTTFTENVVTASNASLNTGAGVYIITIVNKDANNSANPASTMYAVGSSTLTLFLAHMFDLDKYSGLTDLEATYFNPYQYVTSCKWFPLGYDAISGTASPIKYGWYEATDTLGKVVTEYGKTLTWSITVPDNGNWTGKNSEWTHHLLYVPFCGEVEIDPIYSGKTLTITQYIDFNTGGCNTVITDGSNKIISAMNGQAGADVAISQVSGQIDIPTNKAELIAKGAQVLGSAIVKDSKAWLTFGKNLINNIGMSTALSYGQASVKDVMQSASLDGGADVAKSLVDGAKNALINPTVSTSGADGARMSIINRHTMILYTRRYTRKVNATPYTGGMCHQILTLSTLSGYTQLGNGMLEINALDEEKQAIRQLTETGFYIE